MTSTATTTQPGRATADLPEDSGEHAHAAPRLLVFEAAGRRYAAPLDGIREILVARPVTRLPGAPPHVLGLLNRRGSLLSVIDLGVRLEGGEPPARVTGHILVVESEGRYAGCRVDLVHEVARLPELEAAPAGNVQGGTVVLGIGEVDGEPLPVLDLPSIVRQTLLFTGER